MAIPAAPSTVEKTVEVRKKLTPDDVWSMQERGELPDKGYELVDGELIEVPPVGDEHGGTSADIIVPLGVFARKTGGRVYDSSTGFMVGPEYRQLRAPDVSYIGPQRVAPYTGRFIKGAPDLAVEVLSEGQHGQAYAISKIREYFDAGAQLVWFIDLRKQEVRVYRPAADEFAIMRGNAILTLDPIVSGFELRVSDIFRS